MDKNSTPYTLGFAATITIICAVLLGVAATGLKEMQQTNAEVDKKSKTLLALGLFNEKITKEEVLNFFEPSGQKLTIDDKESTHFVVKFAIDHEGKVLNDLNENVLKDLELEPQIKEFPDSPEKRKYPIFAYYSSEDNFKAKKADKYVIPIYGYGLWSNCYGVLALNEKGDTVENIVYYKHGETPGLGGEIEKDYFTKPFQGKKVFNEKGEVALTTTKGVINENTVPAVSGATFTMDGVNNMLKKFITIYDKFFQKKRGGAQ